MDYQRARTPEQVRDRRAEIIHACAAIYEEQGWENVTFTEISKRLSISRPAIYRYYRDRTMVLLDIILQEHANVASEIRDIVPKASGMKRADFFETISSLLDEHDLFLRILSENLPAILDAANEDEIVIYEKAASDVTDAFCELFHAFFTKSSIDDCQKASFVYLVFLRGLYTVAHPSEKEMDAIEQAHEKRFTRSLSYHQSCVLGLEMITANLNR